MTQLDSDLQGNNPPPEGQQENWEARFKGLQKEYNKQQSTLQAKETALTQAVGELTNLKSGNNDALTAAQTSLAQLQSDLKTREQAFQLLDTQHKTVQQQFAALQQKEVVRGKLTALEAGDLLPFVEGGFLSFDSLEDDKIKERVEGFRTLQKSLGGTSAPADLSGSAVPGLNTQTKTNQLNQEKLFEWLMNPDNISHADYQKNSDLYYSSITK